MAVLATVALAFGGSLTLASTATAAPGDVTFVDTNLRNAVNDALSQSHGDPITEIQAATITNLDASGAGISDLAGINYLTGLTHLDLYDNSITSVSPLSGLTNLISLHLSKNSVTDASPLSSLTGLTYLNLGSNSITDAPDLSGLTSLITLYLNGNSITDASPLSSLTGLTYLNLGAQVVDMPSAVVGGATANPVVDIAGDPIVVSSSDTGFAYHSATPEWVFGATGAKTATWNALVSIGDVVDTEFSGTISQNITAAPIPDDVYPQDSEVIQATCDDGDIVGPKINLPVTHGINYTIKGDVTPGATVTVEATLTDDLFLRVEPGSDWVGDSDHIYATLEITLDTVDCDAPPAVDDGDTSQTSTDNGTDSPTSSDDDELPNTGASQSLTLLGVLGALMVLTGTALLAGRRRVVTH